MTQRLHDEYADADLGDERRSNRLVALSGALAVNPAASFPKALGDGAELEGAYRFLSNRAVHSDSILVPHFRETSLRCAERENVVIAHDTTDFVFPGVHRRELGRMRGDSQRGFFAHVALAVSLDELREPLGVLNLHTWTRSKTRSKLDKMSPRERLKVKDRESARWLHGVGAVEERLASGQAIHVMDREADMYELFAALVEKGQRFVVRSSFNRRIEGGQKVSEPFSAQSIVVTREVALARRKRAAIPGKRKAHPPRNARVATLGIKALSVEIRKPRDLPEDLPASRTLNVVVVEELNSPEGEPSVYWRLYTTEPIGSASDLETIVDAYRCRWRIEEFFKALKTGCSIEKRQLETGHALKNALAVFTPIAWNVLRLRSLAHADAGRPAKAIMTALQIRILRKRSKRKLPEALTVSDALLAVAGLGGHLKRNGPPGWITLWRGYEHLLTLEQGALLAAEM